MLATVHGKKQNWLSKNRRYQYIKECVTDVNNIFSKITKIRLTDTDSDGSADSVDTIVLQSKKPSLPSPPKVDDQLPPLKHQNATAVATSTHISTEEEASSTSVHSKSEGNNYSLLPHLTKRWKVMQYLRSICL